MKDDFNIIWNKFYKDLKLLVQSKISNKEDAKDVLQDIFVKVYKNIDSIEDADKLKAWIYKIARNTIIDYYKKAKFKTTNIDNLEIKDEETIDESFNKEISSCLYTFISQLSNADKNIIIKAHFENAKHKDIAKELSISEANSKVKFSRAKKKLKELLSNCCEFEVDKYGNIISYTQKDNCDCD